MSSLNAKKTGDPNPTGRPLPTAAQHKLSRRALIQFDTIRAIPNPQTARNVWITDNA